MLPQTPLDRTGLLNWIATAKKGECLIYHVGLLMFDRRCPKNATPELKAKLATLNAVADEAWVQAGMAWDREFESWRKKARANVNLKQRKLSEPFGYEYIAEKR